MVAAAPRRCEARSRGGGGCVAAARAGGAAVASVSVDEARAQLRGGALRCAGAQRCGGRRLLHRCRMLFARFVQLKPASVTQLELSGAFATQASGNGERAAGAADGDCIAAFVAVAVGGAAAGAAAAAAGAVAACCAGDGAPPARMD